MKLALDLSPATAEVLVRHLKTEREPPYGYHVSAVVNAEVHELVRALEARLQPVADPNADLVG